MRRFSEVCFSVVKFKPANVLLDSSHLSGQATQSVILTSVWTLIQGVQQEYHMIHVFTHSLHFKRLSGKTALFYK